MTGGERERESEGDRGRKGGAGGVWRPGKELVANLAISEKQNALGSWGSRRGEEEYVICCRRSDGETQVDFRSGYSLKKVYFVWQVCIRCRAHLQIGPVMVPFRLFTSLQLVNCLISKCSVGFLMDRRKCH